MIATERPASSLVRVPFGSRFNRAANASTSRASASDKSASFRKSRLVVVEAPTARQRFALPACRSFRAPSLLQTGLAPDRAATRSVLLPPAARYLPGFPLRRPHRRGPGLSVHRHRGPDARERRDQRRSHGEICPWLPPLPREPLPPCTHRGTAPLAERALRQGRWPV